MSHVNQAADASPSGRLTDAPDVPPMGGRHETEAVWARDPRPYRMLLRSGVDWGSGQLERLAVVREAERRLAARAASPDYLPIEGERGFRGAAASLIGAGPHHQALAAPGGTGAFRLLAEVVSAVAPSTRIWLPAPGWPNHARVSEHVGLPWSSYPWHTRGQTRLDVAGIVGALSQASAGDLVLLHAICHNPSGIDPTPEQWQVLARSLRDRQLVAVLDVAFLGFVQPPEVELASARALAAQVELAVWTVSFGKAFRLYGERVGALVFDGEQQVVARLFRHARVRARALWSAPPAHGARVVTEILEDEQLRARWLDHLAEVRSRLAQLRESLAGELERSGLGWPVGHIRHERGLFTVLPLAPEQVKRLALEHAVYLGPTGGLNLTALHGDRVQRLVAAIVAVTGS